MSEIMEINCCMRTLAVLTKTVSKSKNFEMKSLHGAFQLVMNNAEKY
jgi:hypothetical protein